MFMCSFIILILIRKIIKIKKYIKNESTIALLDGKLLNTTKGKGKVFFWPGASQWRIYYHRMWVQLLTTCSNVLKQPNGELLVAINHNQLRTMASETVDPIDWSQSPPSWAVPPERHVHSINQCNLSVTRTCNRSMRGKYIQYEIVYDKAPLSSGCLSDG